MKKMLGIDRHEMIIELLKKEKTLKLNEIISKLNISEATARRDLDYLEKRGYLIRVHGGASLVENGLNEKDISTKNTMNLPEKHKIAKYAAKFIKNGDLIFLDAGSTTEILIQYLSSFKNIKVVTNGFTHINKLLDSNIDTSIIGGNLKSKTGAVSGAAAYLNLKTYNFDIAFIGCNNISSNGVSTPDPDEVIVKEEAVKRSKKVYFLCDKSKLNGEDSIIFAELNDGILITEDGVMEKENIL